MLVKNYELVVQSPPCEPGAERFSASARLETDISEALPYLNAMLDDAVYNSTVHALTWRQQDHVVTAKADQINVGNIEDRDQAVMIMEGLVRQINDTWERRAAITPDHTTYKRPDPMTVYKLLPRTNCKICGESICYNFAIKLVVRQASLEACTPLYEEEGYKEQLEQLEAML